MAFVLFDNKNRQNLAPLSLNKAVADLRLGILTVKERWSYLLKTEVFIHTSTLLQPLYNQPLIAETCTWMDAAIMPSDELLEKISELKPGQALVDDFGVVVGKSNHQFDQFNPNFANDFFDQLIEINNVIRFHYPWDLIKLNAAAINWDFKLITKGKKSQPISPTVQVIQTADIFIEEGAKVEFCLLNSTTGPIYIGKDAEIMEGSTVRGSFVLGENSVLKMNSRIYGATTLGPYCMGGGEIKNAIMMGYSNKAHDGYLGDAVVGEWCNFGAGTSNSNLKNSADEIFMWVMATNEQVPVGQKCGVMMGDYSRVAINSSINTGSVIGICCSVFGKGLLPQKLPNFSFGVEGKKYNLPDAIADINNWKSMKGKQLTEQEVNIINYLYQIKENNNE